ncbi:MAG: hypothetical protein B9J98_00670 [Candidatus Terraquivivens tikiterensis]|uniref:Methyltransferase type 11 domain-containing protein n=1 Tax=Candidatus Terraquivivens tikiterensis TaxID=1980982 RepID=A0A2R7YAN5_9ARCH|nr:MAG: hypothetical protein B9J98_00670 [Candidatus Terraquivivens tikiterensis]
MSMKVYDVVRRYWNEQGAQIYDRINWINREKMKETLLKYLGIDKKGVILDFGTGTGFLASILAEAGYKKIIGVDINEHMLHIAKEKLAGYSVKLVQGDGLHLPIADNSIDAVVSRWVLWVMPNPERAIEEMVRVTRPGGVILTLESDNAKEWKKPSLRRKLSGFPIRHLYSLYLEKVLGKHRGLTTKQFWKETEGKLPLYSLDEYVKIFNQKGLMHIVRTDEEDYGTLRAKLVFGGFKFSLIRGIKPGRTSKGITRNQEWEENELLRIIVCPLCHSSLAIKDEIGYECKRCGKTYPIKHEIPILLPPEDLLQ